MRIKLRTFLSIYFMLFYLTACGGGNSSPPDTSIPKDPPTAERILFKGTGELGIFDPSIVEDPGSGRIWMSYSSVDTSMFYVSTLYWTVSLRLAYSDDNGVNWQDAGVIVAPKVETLVGPMKENHPTGSIPADSQGIWQNETSSIIYDPSAPVAERWKLIWHQYLNANLTSYFADHGWIAMKMASTPLGLATATPVKLFGGAGLQADGSNTGSPVFSPIGGMPVIQLNADLSRSIEAADLAELNLCIFAEPALYANKSAVYLTIYCADASSIPTSGKVTEYVVHFRCSNPCTMTSASNWEYLGRLLTPADALASTGDHYYQAPALVEKNGKAYLIVSPVNNALSDERYSGCRVYEFTDINSNQLRRINGELVEVARVDGDANIHNGACGAYSGLDGGIVFSQLGAIETRGTADMFKIYKGQVSLP